MQQRLKERLVGAAVLVIIAVIFIPMFLTGPIESGSIKGTNIPERPVEKFTSKLVPLTDSAVPAANLQSPEIADVKPEIKQDEVAVAKPKVPTTTTQNVKSKITPTSKKPIKDKQVGLTAWVVQLGSFTSKVNADKLNLTLRKSGFPAFVEPLQESGKTVYRVRVGPELLRSDADALLKKIKASAKLDGIVLSYP